MGGFKSRGVGIRHGKPAKVHYMNMQFLDTFKI